MNRINYKPMYLIQLAIIMFHGIAKAETGPLYDGKVEGVQVAENIFAGYETDCETASDFDLCICSRVSEMADTTKSVTETNNRYRARENDNLYDRTFKKGVRAGMRQVVDSHEKDCIEASVCEDLGEYVAELIAFQYCPGQDVSMKPSSGEYPEACQELSVTECKAHINDAFLDNGCELRVSEVLTYQKKCLRRVIKKISEQK